MLGAGIVIGGPYEISSLDEPGTVICSVLQVLGVFIIGLDTFPLGFSTAIYIYMSWSCNADSTYESAHELHGETHCPSRTVSLTHGLFILVVSIVIVPASIHSIYGRGSRLFYAIGGIFSIWSFAYIEANGVEASHLVEQDNEHEILISAAILIIFFFYGVLPLAVSGPSAFFRDCFLAPWSRLEAPVRHETNVAKSHSALVSLIGLLQVCIYVVSLCAL